MGMKGNNMKKKSKISISTFISILLVICILLSVIYALTPPNAHKAELLISIDKDLLQVVVKYLASTDYDIHIHWITWPNTPIEIEDEDTINAINKLFERRYVSISKRGNTIYFLRWTLWKDFGAGIAYSIDGETVHKIDYISHIESLSKDGWYYYESK